jgi:hypothetical protein
MRDRLGLPGGHPGDGSPLPALPPGQASFITRPSRADPDKIFAQLHSGPSLVTRGTDTVRILDAFAMDLRATLAVASPWRVFIHAGAVGWKGKGIILPGESGSGKTTLTMALLRAGATLFSDEYAVLDRKGMLHPYPLFVRVKNEGVPGSDRVPLEDLDAVPAQRPLPVGLVLTTRYRPEGGSRLARLSEGHAALQLMAHAVQARLRPERVMETAGRAVEGAIALKGPRGEAEELVDAILGLW